jgi:pyruvate dehydrogenase E1 component alpha subunit
MLMENNSVSPGERSGRGSPTSEHSASALSDVPRAYGLRAECIDGTDLDQVLRVAREAVEFVRNGGGPFFVESRTSRWPGNYASSPTLAYGATQLDWAWLPSSAPEPIRQWASSSDPLLRFARRLVDTGDANREMLLAMDSEVGREMDEAVRAALESPEPDAASATDFVVAPPL